LRIFALSFCPTSKRQNSNSRHQHFDIVHWPTLPQIILMLWIRPLQGEHQTPSGAVRRGQMNWTFSVCLRHFDFRHIETFHLFSWGVTCELVLGSMLWSQFSAILPIFGEKIGVFLKNQCYDHNFWKKLAIVWAKNANIFAKFFAKNN
jgi:hypothetical protein